MWSRSKTGKHHPYYVCQNRKCEYKGKSIRRDVLEGAFEKLLDVITPPTSVIGAGEAMFKDLWDHQRKAQQERKAALTKEAAKIDHDLGQLLDRIVDAQSPSTPST